MYYVGLGLRLKTKALKNPNSPLAYLISRKKYSFFSVFKSICSLSGSHNQMRLTVPTKCNVVVQRVLEQLSLEPINQLVD
jgi:hypothetical protein